MNERETAPEMNDHRQKVDIPGMGTWIIESENGTVITFLSEHNYIEGIRANLCKHLDRGAKARYVDPALRFVLLDALDELIRGDGRSGELRTVLMVQRIQEHGLLRSKFVAASKPIFIYEFGLVVFDADGLPLWSRADLSLNAHFRSVEGNEINFYAQRGEWEWSYDLLTGRLTRGAPGGL